MICRLQKGANQAKRLRLKSALWRELGALKRAWNPPYILKKVNQLCGQEILMVEKKYARTCFESEVEKPEKEPVEIKSSKE